MAKVYAFIADGTEECELLCVVDVLRRAGVDTVIVSVSGKTVTSSHGVKIEADAVIGSCDLSDADVLFLPGGMPGSVNLAGCEPLIRAIGSQISAGKRVAAICAAPSVVLGKNGFLKGKTGVCFPGFEDGMLGCDVKLGARVVTDGNMTTARGLGFAIELGLEIVRLLCGEGKAEEIKRKIQF